MAYKMLNGAEQGGPWSLRHLLPRIAAVLVGTLFLAIGLSYLRQPSLQSGEVN